MGEIEFFHHFSYNKKVWLTKTSHTGSCYKNHILLIMSKNTKYFAAAR